MAVRVLDLADHYFQQVLQGEEAQDAAFVLHAQRQMRGAGAELFQRAGNRGFQGQQRGRAQQRAQIVQVLAARHRHQQILGMQDTQYLLAIGVKPRVAAVARFAEFGQHGFHRHSLAQAAHVLAWAHEIAATRSGNSIAWLIKASS